MSMDQEHVNKCIYILCSVSLIILALPSHAQIPGYIGKKTPLSIDIHLFPTLGKYILREESLGINWRTGIGIERVISRKASIGLSLNYFSTQTDYEFDARSGNMKLTGWMWGIDLKSYRFYSRGNIAPIGMYLKPQVQLLSYQLTDQDNNFYGNNNSDLGKYIDLCLGLTYGTQRMITHQIFYNFGFEGAWLINVFNRQDTDAKRYLKQRSSTRLREFLALTVQGGLGVLLF